MNEDMVSFIIPARTEKYLNNTINDILNKAETTFEILVVLDGYPDNYNYQKVDDPRVKYISFPLPIGNERRKRQAVNAAVSISKGKFVCWLDAHCVVAPGFDVTLVNDCEDNMVITPKRYNMNLKAWDKGSEADNYRYFIWQCVRKGAFKQYKWDRRAAERKDIMIDDIFATQGSLFFMTRKWFDKMRFMKVEGYMGWGQEGEEIALTTIFNGGRMVVDKNTWYAHLSKSQMPEKMYVAVSSKPSFDYCYNYWVNEQRDFFRKLINKYSPIPNWPENWEEILDEEK